MNRQKSYFEIPQSTEPVIANAKPQAKMRKLRRPLISLYKTMPHRADMADGPLETIGNVIAWVSELLA
jgi:hypothetical protein